MANRTDYRLLDLQLLRADMPRVDAQAASDAINMLKKASSRFFKEIAGFSRSWDSGHIEQLHARIENALAGCWGKEAKLIFIVDSDGRKSSFMLGAADKKTLDSIQSVFSGALLDVHFQDLSGARPKINVTGELGLITGMPRLPVENSVFVNPVESILAGMQGVKFSIVYLLRAVQPDIVNRELTTLFCEKGEAAKAEQYSESGMNTRGQTRNIVDYSCRQYIADLEQIEQHLLASRETGAWAADGFYITTNQGDAQRLSALIRSAYNGLGGGPEAVICRTRDTEGSSPATQLQHPLADNKPGEIPFTNPSATQLSSKQAATLLMLPTREMPGFYVNEPAFFDLADRSTDSKEQKIRLGDVLLTPYSEESVGDYSFPMLDFSRHALIVGATGGGKSNTVRSILNTLYDGEHKTPFLVIESAKSEYWQLSGFSPLANELCVMPLGEMSSSFRLNPFECTKGFSLQTHVDSLLSTFKAAFEMYTPMPFILEQAVYEVYADYGWDIATGQNSRKNPQYPMLADLYWQIPITVEKTAYDKEIKDNVTGALQTRVRSLMIGGKGLMMNVRKSTPLNTMLGLPVVLELESLGDDETKAFVMGLLMNRLYEFRRVESAGRSCDFKHLLIIEEAHRLLKNVPQEQDSSRAASVEFFCNMLSEIRSYGQGILIADQSPVKLARDSLRNTNLKIVHRIVDQDDRNSVGGAMHMEDSQKEALTVLRRGVAAVYSEGDNRPKLVKFPLVQPDGAPRRERALGNANRLLRAETAASADRSKHAACRYCPFASADGTCRKEATANESRRIAGLAFQRAAENQQVYYINEYRQHGPNALLTDAIVLFALGKEMERRGIPEESREESAWNESADKKRCIAGFTLQQLSALDRDMPELIAARYDNLLRKRL